MRGRPAVGAGTGRTTLDVERVRSRVSAYVCADVLVLAAVVGCAGRRQPEAELHLRAVPRDATPVDTSGVLPEPVLLVASLAGWEGTAGAVAQLVAGGSSGSAFWSAVGLAAVGPLIAVVTVLLTH